MSGMTAAVIILLQVSAVMGVIWFVMDKLLTKPFEKYLDILRSRGIPNRSYNVGCMLQYMNYTPRTLKEIECGYWELKKEKNNGEEKNI